VVVQADAFNRSRLRTVVVVTVTTNLRLAAIPGNVFLPAATTGLPEDSVVNVTQVATLDRADLESRVGGIPSWLVAEVERGLRRVLGL
jgi:mRNA interferase MazF